MSYEPLLLVIGGYLLGSVATAVLVSRLMGLPDPRSVGSGNPGATNVLRHGGRKAAALTLLGDVLKGVAPVVAARLLHMPPEVVAATGLAAFLGHLYPVFFGFRGGKGVATALGVLLGMAWPVALATLATWLLMAYLLRYSSLAAVTAAVLAPGFMAYLPARPPYVAAAIAMGLLLIWRHRTNLRRLLEGTEGKIGARRSGPSSG